MVDVTRQLGKPWNNLSSNQVTSINRATYRVPKLILPKQVMSHLLTTNHSNDRSISVVVTHLGRFVQKSSSCYHIYGYVKTLPPPFPLYVLPYSHSKSVRYGGYYRLVLATIGQYWLLLATISFYSISTLWAGLKKCFKLQKNLEKTTTLQIIQN